MHATTPAPAALTATQTGEKIPEDVLPLMDSAREFVRSKHMNRVEKIRERSAILDRITDLPSSFGLVGAELETNQGRRRELWAQFHAFRELETEENLTAERREQLQKRAHEKLPELERYAFAASLAKDVESDWEQEPSRTAKRLAEFAKEREDDVSDALSYALTKEEISLLSALNGRANRRTRFRAYFSRGYAQTVLVDVPVRAPYAAQKFDSLVRSCSTLSEVKELLAIWATEYRVERREGASVVVAKGFEVVPV